MPRISFVLVDHCPVCNEKHTVTLVGELEDFPEEVKFFCVDHGAWFLPFKIKLLS